MTASLEKEYPKSRSTHEPRRDTSLQASPPALCPNMGGLFGNTAREKAFVTRLTAIGAHDGWQKFLDCPFPRRPNASGSAVRAFRRCASAISRNYQKSPADRPDSNQCCDDRITDSHDRFVNRPFSIDSEAPQRVVTGRELEACLSSSKSKAIAPRAQSLRLSCGQHWEVVPLAALTLNYV